MVSKCGVEENRVLLRGKICRDNSLKRRSEAEASDDDDDKDNNDDDDKGAVGKKAKTTTTEDDVKVAGLSKKQSLAMNLNAFR